MSNKYDISLDLETKNSLSVIVDRIKPYSVVLEFGPANGRMTKYLKEVLNCKIYAVEVDTKSAKDAAQFCERIIVDDVEKYVWLKEFSNIQFDYIVFADVLEHLYYPNYVLKKAKSLLHDNGSILISLPNIAHNTIIMELLRDKFTYNPTGLLDNTHIRFFTKSTLDKLLEECGLQIQYETGIYINPKDTEFWHQYSDFDDCISNELQNRSFGEVYQFIVESKKKVTNPFIDFKNEKISTLYVDNKDGFNEQNRVFSSFNYQEDSEIIFLLDNPFNDVLSIRIDPLECAINMKISKIFVNEIEVKDGINHNGLMNKNGDISFLHNDPQIIVHFNNTLILTTVKLTFENLSIIPNMMQQKIQEKDLQIQEKDLQIQEKDLQIQEKDLQIINLIELANSMRIKNRILKLFRIYK